VFLADGTQATGEPANNKKLAEASAATQALKALQVSEETDAVSSGKDGSPKCIPVISPGTPIKTKLYSNSPAFILIDAENQQKACETLSKSFEWSDPIKVVWFVSKVSPLSDKNYPNQEKVVINSTHRDGADTGLIWYAAQKVMGVTEPVRLFIWSRDHFVGSLIDCIHQFTGATDGSTGESVSENASPNVKAIHVIRATDLINNMTSDGNVLAISGKSSDGNVLAISGKSSDGNVLAISGKE